MEYKIIQIMPASGWYATYTDMTDFYDPVVCFALIKEDEAEQVVPMVHTDGYLDRVDQLDNYSELVYLPNHSPPQPQ